MKRALLLAVLWSCGPDASQVQQPQQQQPEQQQPQPQQPQPEQQPVLTGLPCDVRTILETNCAGCHVRAVYLPAFATRDDLLKLGTKVKDRLMSSDAPMPPYQAERQPSADERATVARWVEAGMPAGECGGLQ